MRPGDGMCTDASSYSPLTHLCPGYSPPMSMLQVRSKVEALGKDRQPFYRH